MHKLKKLTGKKKELEKQESREIRGGLDTSFAALNCVHACDSNCGTRAGSKGAHYEAQDEFWND